MQVLIDNDKGESFLLLSVSSYCLHSCVVLRKNYLSNGTRSKKPMIELNIFDHIIDTAQYTYTF